MAKRSAPTPPPDGTGNKKVSKGGNVAPNGTEDGSGSGSGSAADQAGGSRKKRKVGLGLNKDMSPRASPAPSNDGGNDDGGGGVSSQAAQGAAANGNGTNGPQPQGQGGGDSATAETATSESGAAAVNNTSNATSAQPEGPSSKLSTRSGSGPDAPPREVQVQALLTHRKLLLNRIRRCREAAATRLKEPPRSIVNGSDTSSGAAAAAETSSSPKEDEMEAFKAMSQRAITATKRQSTSTASASASAANVPAATDRGLRRGGSVGRKMAAAVSTLQNAGSLGGWVSDSSTNSSKNKAAATGAGAGAGAGAGGPLHPNAPGALTSGKNAAALKKSASSVSSASAIGNKQQQQQQQQQLASSAAPIGSGGAAAATGGGGKSSKKRPKSSSPTLLSSGASGSKSKKKTSDKDGSSGGGGASKKKKGDKSSSASAAAAATAASGGQYTLQQQQQQQQQQQMRHHHQQQQAGLVALGAMDPTTLALLSRPKGQEAQLLKQYTANPRVVCPQARSLRARRDAIRDKLERLVKERKEREAKLMNDGLNCVVGRGSGDAPAGTNAAAAAISAEGTAASSAAAVPPPLASPTSVACKTTSAITELVKTRPHFKTYAWEQKRLSLSQASSSSTPTPSAATSAGRRSPLSPQPQPQTQKPFQPEPRNPTAASRPTPRRKTHWDYVLEEMTWTATDYESERRWKGAVGRTLSASVLAFHAANGGGKGSPLKSSKPGGAKGTPKTPGSSAKKKRRGATTAAGSTPTLQSAEESMGDDGVIILEEEEEEELEPTSEDLDRARVLSKALSILLAGHWDLVTKENTASAGGSGGGVLSSRGNKPPGHKNMSGSSSGSDSAGSGAIYWRYKEAVKGIPGMSEPNVGGVASAGALEMQPSDATVEEGEEKKDVEILSHETVTERLEAALSRADLVGTQPSKKKRPVESADCSVELQPSQVDAIHFVEAVWEAGCSVENAPALGVVLSGKVASGKTVAMAATLWRHGDEGPQLLLCHSARLIRWRHELRRFGNLNVLTFGDHGWLFDDDAKAASFKSGDVILCEFSSLHRFISDVRKGVMSLFATVAVDSRCPKSDALSKKREGESLPQAAGAVVPEVASSEVTSTKWWKHLLHALPPSSLGTKRLIIEGPTPLEDAAAAAAQSSSSGKKCVELLAMKVAFIHHPTVFCSSRGNVGRSVISWAKKRHRAIVQDAAATTDLAGMKTVLGETLEPLSHSQEMYDQPNAEVRAPSSWEVRLCKFPPSQQQAYEECCCFVRGSLSLSTLRLMGGDASQLAPRARRNAQTLWAQAILRLRRACVHSNLEQAAAQGSSYPSSPQLETAKAIMANSAKMKELTNILQTECGHRIVADEADDEFTQLVPMSSGASIKKKVLVLASLPEAQVLVSKLLSSLGIAHGKLLSLSSPATASRADRGTTADETAIIDSLAWIENQHSLSRFNADSEGGSKAGGKRGKSSGCDVLIASPSMIGSQYGGLSASAADVVISIDEDWSGHSQELIESILARNLMHHGLGEDPHSSKLRPKWIKLVCDSSCEKIFLFPDGEPSKSVQEDDADESPPKKKQKRGGGRKTRKGRGAEKAEKKAATDKASSKSQGLVATYISSANVLKFRNKALTAVLGEHCKPEPDSSDSSDVIFLPSLTGEASDSGEENRATLNGAAAKSVPAFVDEDGAPFANALMHEEMRISSALPSSDDSIATLAIPALSSLSISRRDIQSVCVRAYVQQLAQVLSSASSGTNKQPSMLLSNGAAAGGGRLRVSGSDTDLADAWRKSGFGCNPIDMAASALYIGPGTGSKDDADADASTLADTKTSDVVKDGSEGQDQVVYFPPPFPNMLLNGYNKISQAEQRKAIEEKQAALASASEALSTTATTAVNTTTGGKQAGGKRPRNSKGMSTSRTTTAAPRASPTTVPSSSVVEAAPAGVMALKDATSSAVASGAAAVATKPGSSDSAQASVKERGEMNDALVPPSNANDVFGMSGLPDPRESAQAAAKTLTGCLSYPYFDEEAIDSDVENEPEMGSMILFTKKGTSMLRRASSLMPTFNAFGMPVNNPSGKKSKKCQPQQPMTAVSPWAQPNVSSGNDMQMLAQIWDSRALNLLAQRGINPQRALRHASVRMRHRLSDRVTQLFISTGTSLGAGHGVPQLYLAQEASGAATATSTALVPLSRTPNAPCRTDFGPFKAGYLAAKNGMVGIQPKRPKLGISLPMGVRMPQHREVLQLQHGQPRSTKADENWSKDEDKKLTESVLQWKENWHLIARAVSQVGTGATISEVKDNALRTIRSPRQCRERWKVLLKASPDLQAKWSSAQKDAEELKSIHTPGGVTKSFAKALEESKKLRPRILTVDRASDKDKLLGRPPSLLLRKAVSEIAIQAEQDKAGQDKTEQNPMSAARSRARGSIGSRLSNLKRAMAKKKTPKLQIPGVTGPEVTSLAIVSSHPSHAQSVELAVSQATGSSGMAPPRMEMWPLQILDYADKVKAAKAGKPIPSSRKSVSSRGSAGSSSRKPAPGSSASRMSQQQHQQQAAYRQSGHGVPPQRPPSQPHPAARANSNQGARPVPRPGGPVPLVAAGTAASSYAPRAPPAGVPKGSPMQPSRNIPPSSATAGVPNKQGPGTVGGAPQPQGQPQGQPQRQPPRQPPQHAQPAPANQANTKSSA